KRASSSVAASTYRFIKTSSTPRYVKVSHQSGASVLQHGRRAKRRRCLSLQYFLWSLTCMKIAKLGLETGFVLSVCLFAFWMGAVGEDAELGNEKGGDVGTEGREEPAARPAPRGPDGRVLLGPVPGEAGVWLPGPGGTPGEPWPPKPNELPFQDWARALFTY